MKTLNFLGSFVACDLKVVRYRQLVELMKCYESKPWPKVIYKLNVKLNFLSLTNQSQILYVVSLGWRNKSLYKWSRSHDQDGHHGYK